MDYGLIGNGQTCALISSKASIDWCCMPTFDSSSVFARLLDHENGGYFSIVPTQRDRYVINQQYVKNTNVLETTFISPAAVFKVIDFMPRWPLDAGEFMYHPCQVYRLIEIVTGTPEVIIDFNPKLNYARSTTELKAVNSTTIEATDGESALYLTTNLPPTVILQKSSIPLAQGSFFVLSYQEPVALAEGLAPLDSVLERLNKTVKYWRRWVRSSYLPKEYQTEIIRSALTLKQLVYEDTGAIIASPTTSLPEIIGGNRNWDYRFCWLRDAYFIIEALLKIAHYEVVEGFINYLKRILEEQNRLDYVRPLFTIEGAIVPEEIALSHLKGYRNSRPVHIGNSATTHFQNDVYGELVLCLYPLFTDERVVRSDTEYLWEVVYYLVEIARKKFDQEDNGLWELRNFPRHHTFSKLMAWVALDRGIKIAKVLKKERVIRRWIQERDRMREDILEKAWNPELQAFTQCYGCSNLDASTLLMPILGIIPAKDQRMVSTILLSEKLLMKNGLAFRYTNEDDFGCPENAFTICTFWMIDALAMIGQKRRARRYFENLMQYANHLGLFSEDINPETYELTGNFPQGYTHVAIINTAMTLAKN